MGPARKQCDTHKECNDRKGKQCNGRKGKQRRTDMRVRHTDGRVAWHTRNGTQTIRAKDTLTKSDVVLFGYCRECRHVANRNLPCIALHVRGAKNAMSSTPPALNPAKNSKPREGKAACARAARRTAEPQPPTIEF